MTPDNETWADYFIKRAREVDGVIVDGAGFRLKDGAKDTGQVEHLSAVLHMAATERRRGADFEEIKRLTEEILKGRVQ